MVDAARRLWKHAAVASQASISSPAGPGPARGSERTAIAALLVAFWVAFQLIFYTYGAFAQDEAVSGRRLLVGLVRYVAQPVELLIVAAGAALSLATYLVLRGLRGISLWKQLVAAIGLAILSAAYFTVAISLLCGWFGVPWPALTPRFLLVDTIRWFAPFGLWAGIALTVTYNGEVRERERRLALLQAQAKDAQMRALRYQVNPHLLYNTLNSIAALILDGRNELAEAMVMRLSSFFRASLSNDPHADVTLAEEVALQRLYLEIEQMRFPNLTTEFDVPHELGSIPVPSLILQPLVENVLKHGINPHGMPTHLFIGARRENRQLVLEVRDNGPGTSGASGTGVGLANVAGRLRSRFGDGAHVAAVPSESGGFAVRMNIPVGRHG